MSQDDDHELDRKKRIEASIRAREEQVRQALNENARELDRERVHHRRDEAKDQFSALLSDLVRTCLINEDIFLVNCVYCS